MKIEQYMAVLKKVLPKASLSMFILSGAKFDETTNTITAWPSNLGPQPDAEKLKSALLEFKIEMGLKYLASKGLTAPILTVLSNIRSSVGGTFPAGTPQKALCDYIDGIQGAALAGQPLTGEPPTGWKQILGA